MSKQHFQTILKKELERIDAASVAKRNERIIEGFTFDPSPKAIINGNSYHLFNSNDYLGLRHHRALKEAEHTATEQYGSGPGAVRFISGTMKIYKDLEASIATFHNREAGMVFSSAFAANLAVLACLAKGQSKDSVVSGETLVVSDELNHRSIIDGIRVASLPKEQKTIYKHMDYSDLDRVLDEQRGTWKRVLVVTDGIFSMLGEYADLKSIKEICSKHDGSYEEGVLLVVDDSHGVGGFGQTGRGVEEITDTHADVLVGTFGKGFGSDGGYVVADQITIDYLRESSATYIFSNSISPGVAGSALTSVSLVDSEEGKKLLQTLRDHTSYFKEQMKNAGFTFASDSIHPIQPILIGDAAACKQLTEKLFAQYIVVTSINYPVVPKGKDEIRVQINASHTKEDIDYFIEKVTSVAKKIGIIK